MLSDLKKAATKLGIDIRFNVLPLLYSPSSDVDFSLIDTVNSTIKQFNDKSGQATFQLNNYVQRRVLEGRFG